MDVRVAYHVTESGNPDGPVMLFAHGFGCDQNMWRFVAPHFARTHRVVLFDYPGSGRAQAAHDPVRHASLDGYAEDVLRVVHGLGLRDVVLVGHSVSAMVGVLAERREPELFEALVMVGPSPRYLNDTGYVGGFEPDDIDGLLASLESNYLGWSAAMAPVIMGNPERPALGAELESSFCSVDPDVAECFARATFLADNRADLPHVRARTLVLQAREDAIAPLEVGTYVASQVPSARMVVLDAVGHCPHLSAPEAVIAAMRDFLEPQPIAGA
jgi:sigma-B regulation protein RsbQ